MAHDLRNPLHWIVGQAGLLRRPDGGTELRKMQPAEAIERAVGRMNRLILSADRDRLLQIFENLIGNALKFTSAPGRVTVGATITEGEVEFRVADTGRGHRPGGAPLRLRPFLPTEASARELARQATSRAEP